MSGMRATGLSALALVLLSAAAPAIAQTPVRAAPVSYVDTSLSDSQKYVLRVQGKPFYMTNIQVRLDKLRYTWGWDAAAREAVFARAAADGFNTVSVPIQWAEVEPEKNRFDWTVLDEYLGLAAKHNLKVELLWFGQNSVGTVGRMNPQTLRTPAYVLASPANNSPDTTSEYRIRRDISNYTLDLADERLRARETYVLGQVMAHVAAWDAANGSKKVVIGVQLGNEVRGVEKTAMFPADLVITHLNALGAAVKSSPYVVWTRVNSVYLEMHANIEAHQKLRSTVGTTIDFVGIDSYDYHFENHDQFVASFPTNIPYARGNYRMFMEVAAEFPRVTALQLGALYGNNGFDYYDMVGPDGHGLYDRDGTMGMKPHGAYVEDVRAVNRLINSANTDIALNAQGNGLAVHNWAGDSVVPTPGVEGVTFTPADAPSHGFSITRSNTELVVMNTRGGTFTYPASLGVVSAAKGYFDRDNKWVDQGAVAFTATAITPPAGTAVRLMRKDTGTPKTVRRQVEFAALGSGAVVKSDNLGFAGDGYVELHWPGAYAEWMDVDGLGGGQRSLQIRYANGGKTPQNLQLFVNGVLQTVSLPVTGSWTTYGVVTAQAPLNAGPNTVRLQTHGGTFTVDEIGAYR